MPSALSQLRERKAASDSSALLQLRNSKTSNPSLDVNELDGLTKLARLKGLDVEGITETPRLSILQRLMSGLNALNPAEATLRGIEGTESFLTAYPKTVLSGIASALTGTDYGEQTKKRYFSDIAEYLGVENKIARFGLGLVGDILLDPSTYVGGTIVRGAVRGTGILARGAGRRAATVAGKLSPELAEAGGKFVQAGQELFSTGAQLFVDGYGATKEAVENFYKFRNTSTNLSRGLAISNMKRYGTDVLTDDQWTEFLDKMFLGKTKEFEFFDTTFDEGIKALSKRFPELARTLGSGRKGFAARIAKEQPEAWKTMSEVEQDLYVKSAMRTSVLQKLERVGPTMGKKISKLQELRARMARPEIQGDLAGMQSVVADLRKEIDGMIGIPKVKIPKGKIAKATGEQYDTAIANALGYEKDHLKKTILDLEAKLKQLTTGVLDPAEIRAQKLLARKERLAGNDVARGAMRAAGKTAKDRLVAVDRAITTLTNEMLVKQHLLENILQSKTIAKGIIKKAFDSGDFSSLPEDVARALRPTSDDPLVRTAIEDRLRRNKVLAEAAGIDANDTFTVYAPSIRGEIPEKQRLLDFFQGTRRLSIGSEGYKKEFRNLLKDSELLKDRSLFLRVEDQVATNALKREFMNETVGNFGKPLEAFKNEAAAEAAGYKMLREKGMFGKELGYLLKDDFNFINGKIGNNYMALDAIAKATGFDALNSLFKRFVTGPFASFYVRNFASGKVQNYEVLGYHALLPQTIANGTRIANKVAKGAYADIPDFFQTGVNFGKKVKAFGAKEFLEAGTKRYALDDIGKAINDRFANSNFFNNDYNSLTREADLLSESGAFSKESMRAFGKKAIGVKPKENIITALVSQDSPHWKAGRIVGNFIELQQKSEAVVGALYKGHTLDEALDLAERAGFDYSKLTAFESHVMRRIMPFYTFTRKNIELQLKTLGEHPERIQQVIRSIQNTQSLFEVDRLSDDEKKNLPTYLREALAFPIGKNAEGAALFVQGFGTPIEQFTQLVRASADGKTGFERTMLNAISQVTPYLKAPLEYTFQTDSFRMRDIQEIYSAKEYATAPGFVKTFLQLEEVKRKDANGKPYTTYAANPDRYWLARSLFTHRGFTYVSNIFNGDLPVLARVAEGVSGIRSDDVNLEYYAGLSERRQKEEITAILRRYGLIAEFSRAFIPKEKD